MDTGAIGIPRKWSTAFLDVTVPAHDEQALTKYRFKVAVVSTVVAAKTRFLEMVPGTSAHSRVGRSTAYRDRKAVYCVWVTCEHSSGEAAGAQQRISIHPFRHMPRVCSRFHRPAFQRSSCSRLDRSDGDNTVATTAVVVVVARPSQAQAAMNSRLPLVGQTHDPR